LVAVQPQTPAVPPPPHVSPAGQLHVTVPPQPLLKLPQAPPVHGLVGVQPQTSVTPPPPHVCGAVHVPQDTLVPQLFVAVPQFRVVHAAVLFGTHVHSVVGVPTQVSLEAHAVHWVRSPQPLFTSSGTHWLPHFFVLVPHVPMTHAPF
jgi:hypothetical protein